MFKSYANKITSFLIENKEIEKEDYEVYKYGFEVLIAFIVNISMVLSIGLIFDKVLHSIVFLICYCPIRQFAGGYHADSYMKCLLIFILIFLSTIYVSTNIDFQTYKAIIFTISTLSYISIFLLAPIEHRNNPLNLNEIVEYKKISRLLACIVYILTLTFISLDTLNELSVYTCSSLFWINIMLCLGSIKSSQGERN